MIHGKIKRVALYNEIGFYVHNSGQSPEGENQFFFTSMFTKFPFINGVYGFPIVKVFETMETYEIKGYFK